MILTRPDTRPAKPSDEDESDTGEMEMRQSNAFDLHSRDDAPLVSLLSFSSRSASVAASFLLIAIFCKSLGFAEGFSKERQSSPSFGSLRILNSDCPTIVRDLSPARRK